MQKKEVSQPHWADIFFTMVPNINPFSSHKNILVQLCPTLRDGYKNLSTKKDLDQVQVFLPRSSIACLRRVVFHCFRFQLTQKNIPDQLVYVASPAVHSPDDGQSFPRLHPVCGRWKGHKAPSIYQKHPTMPKNSTPEERSIWLLDCSPSFHTF